MRLREARILTGSRTLEFVHPLIATAVYRAIPDAVRVALHGQAAWAVVDAGLGPGAAARHLLETHPEGDPAVVHQLRAAAGEMLRAGAPEAARSHLARALREPPPANQRAAVLYELGCCSQLLEPSTTVNHLRAALEEPIDDPELRDDIHFRLSQSLAHSDRLSEAAEVVGHAARTATSARTRLRMQSEQFMWDAFRADEPDSPSRSRRLTRLADRLTGRDLTERYIIGLRAWDATLRGEHTSTVLRHAGRALEGGLPWAVDGRGFEVPVLVAMTYMYSDRPDRAEELFATGIADFERQGWRGAHLSFGYLLLGYVRYRGGRLAEAEELARDGLRLAERVGRGTPVQWYSVAVLIEILLARGRVDEATALAAEYAFREPFPAAVTFPDAQAVHGELLLARGLHREAAAVLSSVGRRLDPRGMRNPAWCPWQLDLALAEAHDAPLRARETALDAVTRARQFGADSAIGHALRVAAEVVDDNDEALKLLAEAVDRLSGSPSAYQLACALVAHGTALRRAGAGTAAAAESGDPAEPEEPEEIEAAAETAAPVAARSQGPAAEPYEPAVRDAVHRVIRERRDIRNGFRSDPIPHEVLLRVLEAAHTAPSVGHSQPWDFVVIRSAKTRERMHALAMEQRDAYAKSLPKARARQFRELKIEAILDTPVNIVVTADPTRGGRHTLGRHTQPQMAPYSSALAVENLWLAARAEGLGVGWVSFFDERQMVEELGLPDHLEVVAYLCVGYVDEFPEEPELMQAGWSQRRPLSWVVHEEEYGNRALPGEEPHDLLEETLRGIRPLDAKALGEAWERQKRMTKPAGALGMLEIISAQLSGLSRKCPPPIPEPAAVAIFAGDHGVHAQGVTAWPQEVTGQMVANFLGGGAVCNAFANQVGAEVCVIDVGVASELPTTPGLLPRKVRPGTADFTTGPAMSRDEALRAIEVGIETARDLVAAGNKALLTGEMGIANTTTSAALIAVFTGVDPAEVTGRGTGINDEMHARKVDVVRRALDLHRPDPADPIAVLTAVGGEHGD
ncbi:5,6-dimethylbenzimidazole synthase, partial [Actinacidiphila rubida]|uniref:5,6-dimethylbenzimidazole synthase n=1 Tax=Actinacidiphila rubida TaxID=310780 RepID=UPI002AFDE1AD